MFALVLSFVVLAIFYKVSPWDAQGAVSKPPRTASYGLKYAIIVKANSFYDSGTSYLFTLMLLRYVSDLFFT